MSNASGNFVYYHVLNGIVGTYTVTATDGVNSASTTFAESRYRLQGYTRLPHAGWTDGILKGWFECEEVPYRLRMTEVEATTYVLSNYHDNKLQGITGIDYCSAFYVGYENGSVAPTTEATFSVSGPFYYTPVKIKEIYYTWNVTYTSKAAGKTYHLYWKAHLASGSSNWPGAKLHAKTDVTGAQDVPIAVPPKVLGKISGYKFNDLDRDGVWDVSEPVLTDGWNISLYIWDETTSQWVFQTSTTTDINGTYEFTSLFYGDYKVTEDVKDGWINTLSPGFPITLNDTYPTSEDNNFGNYALAPPVACFTVSNDSPNVCETVTFNASYSYDPDGVIVKYEWDWEGDCVYDFDAGNNPIAYHHYDTYGYYYPKLRVTDNDGLTDETNTTIHVRQHPVARFDYSPLSPRVCGTVTFNASASTPDGGTIISYEWDFGDGNITIIGDDEPITPIITHHYTAPQDYNVTLTVTDSEEKSDAAWKMITVTPIQHYLTVKTDPADIVTIPGEGWYDNCTYVNLTAPMFVPNETGAAGERYRFDHWTVDGDIFTTLNVTVHMDANHTATAHYVQQYLVTFGQTGLDVNATGTVVTVNGSAKTFGDLPFTWWIDNCSWVEYSYSVLVSSLDPNENFTLINVTGPVSPFHVGSPVTVTGNYQSIYKVQYYLDVSSAYGTPGGMGWYDDGDTAYATLDTGVIDHGNGTRRVFTHWSGDTTSTDYSQSDPITMDGNKTAIANWKTQYYLTVTSVHGTPGGEGWYNASDTAYATITPLTVAGPTGVQYVFTGWSGDASGSGSPSDPITMDGPKTAVADWKTQYYLTVVSPYGTPGGEGWYDSGSTAYATVTPLVVSGPPGVQYVFTGWSGDASGSSSPSDPIVMDGPKTATADWKTQYYLTVTSPYDSPTPTSGWFDVGTSITASVTSPWPGPTGTRYICTGWTGTGSVPASGTATTVTFTIDAPSSITWTWVTQYYLTVKTDPTGLSPAPTPPSGWYNESTNVLLTAQLVTGYTFINWDVDGTNVTGNPINVHMDQPHTATAHYQVYVAPSKCVVDFTEDPESPIWFGTTVTFTVNVTQKAFNGTHEVNCTLYEWNLTDPKGVSHILRFGKQWNNFSDTMQWTFNVYGSWTVTLKAFCNDTALIGLGMAWSDPASHIKYVSMPVGGHIVPVCKLDLLVPWTGFVLGLLAALAATIALFRLRIRKH